jgi:hypothetical protein
VKERFDHETTEQDDELDALIIQALRDRVVNAEPCRDRETFLARTRKAIARDENSPPGRAAKAKVQPYIPPYYLTDAQIQRNRLLAEALARLAGPFNH